jgi:acetyl-CoA acetyltransferase
MTGQESVRAQSVLRRTGLAGVPMVNVDNACASSSTALHLAWQAIAGGMYDCAVVIGYEKLHHVDKARTFRAVNATMDVTDAAEMFGSDGRLERSLFMDLYGAASSAQGGDLFDPEPLALVSVKNHYHGSLNPLTRYHEQVTVEQVLAAPQVSGPLTKLMCAQPGDGAACLVVCAPAFRRGRTGGVRIAASVLKSGRGDDMRQGYAAVRALRDAYDIAGVGPEDLDVIETHDSTAIAELLSYIYVGLCDTGDPARLVKDRVTWLGGRVPVNPSGGMLSRGHPAGATGAAQIVELTWQLEGRCGQRQVPSARLALADNMGGWVGTDVAACGVHILQV